MKFSIKKSKKFFVKIILLSFVAYIIFLFINQQVKIKNKTDELSKFNEQIAIEKSKNSEIKNKLEEVLKNGESSTKSSRRVFENVAE